MKSSPSDAEPDQLYGELASLPALGPERLKERWRFFTAPNRHPHQRRSAETRDRLPAPRARVRRPQAFHAPTAPTDSRGRTTALVNGHADTQALCGPVLIREWQGTSHQVTVLEDGVLFRGKRHRSLSEVARKITGNRCAGQSRR